MDAHAALDSRLSPMRIVIVGGGTAGWMAAVGLKTVFGGRMDITLVESDEIGIVGVGEATIPAIQLFNQLIGLDEDEFVRETQASFKLGIEFVDWYQRGHRYIHAFGPIGVPVGNLAFYQYWLKARSMNQAQSLWSYSLNANAAAQGRFTREIYEDTPFTALAYAFHFDAALYSRYLRRLAEARFVKRVEGKIVRVQQDAEQGHVQTLQLADGRTVPGDFFIDCSGFRGLLIEETLKSGYEDWTHFLPADRALAVPCGRVDPLTPFTRATARDAGWQWRIPLQHRTGNGHVFSTAFTSVDAAHDLLVANLDGERLADPREIRFTTGRRKLPWMKNVVAFGLASGFLEPLESTSIHMVQSALQRLIRLFPRQTITDAAIAEYNRQTHEEYDRIRDFIILHYKANARTDTPFWKHCANMAVPDSLSHAIDIFRSTGSLMQRPEDLFTEVSWIQVLIGQGIMPTNFHPMADRLTDADLQQFMRDIASLAEGPVDAMPAHGPFIRQHCQSTDQLLEAVG